MSNLSKKNKEIYENNTQMKKEIKCKDEMLKLWNEKFHKLNEEKESIRIMNRELQKNIDELKNQCNDYQTVINYNQEQIKLLKEKNNKGIGKFSSKKVSFNLPVKENDDKKVYAMKILKKKAMIKRNQVKHIKTERKQPKKVNITFF